MIEFKALNCEKLEHFIDSKEFLELENLPISYHRAISQINNPRIEKEDTLLLLAYINNDICGYLGTVPDRCYIDEKKYVRCAWMSCIWVSDKHRGKGIAYQLLTEMYKLWNGNLVITNYTETAKKLYDKSGYFTENIDYNGLRGYLRLNLHQLLTEKNPKWKKFKWFLLLVDTSFNIINAFRLLFVKQYGKVNDLQIEKVSEIDEEVLEIVPECNSITRRGKDELNWIVKYPWLKNGNPELDEARKYAFSSFSEDFRLVNLKIRNKGGALIGFLMLHIRDRQMRIPYAYFSDMGVACHVIYHYMLKQKIRTLTVFNNELVQYINEHSSPFFKVRGMLRQYMVSKVFSKEFKNIKEFVFHDGDGDSAFT